MFNLIFYPLKLISLRVFCCRKKLVSYVVTVHDSATTVEAGTEGAITSSEDGAGDSDAWEDDVGHLKTERVRKPNPRVTGPEWIK
jgi:hypothetical protein